MTFDLDAPDSATSLLGSADDGWDMPPRREGQVRRLMLSATALGAMPSAACSGPIGDGGDSSIGQRAAEEDAERIAER